MGMYSYFSYEDIKVIDSKGLVEFLFKAKDDKEYNAYMYESFLNDLIDGKPYSFEEWDNIKLISYWYPHQVLFLQELGKYIEGNVQFSFETEEEGAIIEFKDGETTIKIGRMEYRDFTPNQLLEGRK